MPVPGRNAATSVTSVSTRVRLSSSPGTAIVSVSTVATRGSDDSFSGTSWATPIAGGDPLGEGIGAVSMPRESATSSADSLPAVAA